VFSDFIVVVMGRGICYDCTGLIFVETLVDDGHQGELAGEEDKRDVAEEDDQEETT